MAVAPDDMIRGAAVAAVVCDPRQADNPIVACNDRFLDLTGYPRDEVLGRNCRFLCGPETEPEQRAELRDAVAEARSVMVTLTNYRKDRSKFLNAVMIAPVFDDVGDVIYLLGSQVAVEDDALSGKATARLQHLSRRQREVLDGLAKGRLHKQIAHELGLSERTVKMHRAALLRALGVKSTADAIRLAIEARH